MRRLLIPLAVLLVFAWTSGALAQVQPDPPPDNVITCDDITESIRDTVAVMPFCGKPDDTAYLPLRLKNDSTVVLFQFLMDYDTTFLRPAFLHDTISVDPLVIDSQTFVDHVVKGDFSPYPVDHFAEEYVGGGRVQVSSVRTIPSPFGDVNIPLYKTSVTRYESYNSQFVDSVDVLAINFLNQGDDFDSISPGNDVILWVKFLVKPDRVHGQTSLITWYQENIYIIDTNVFPPQTIYFDGCNRAQMVVAEFDGSETQTFQRYPKTRTGGFSVEDDCPAFDPGGGGTTDPVINSFLVNGGSSASVSPGANLTFDWNTGNVTEIQIDLVGGSTVHTSTQAVGQVTLSAPTTDNNYTYVLTARNATSSTTRSVSVTVSTGGGGGAPTITFNPAGGVYTVEQGVTLSFTVTATDPDGKQTTLTATSLPANATFTPNPAVGQPTATGNFSFTPDFSQSGTLTASFSASDLDGQSSTRSASITVTEIQFDRLFSTSAEGQAPVGGLPGTEGILFPINVVTSQTVYGVQFDMAYPIASVSIDSFLVTDRIPDWTVWDNIGDTPGQIRVITLGLANEPMQTGTSTAVLHAAMTLDSNTAPWTSIPITMENGRESVNPDPNVGSLPMVTDNGIIEVDSVGDVNLDKFIDVGDAVSSVGTIIGDFLLSPRQFATADIILDNSIDVFDLVGIINSIFGYPVSTTPVFSIDTAVIAVEHDPLQTGATGLLTVASDLPEQVAGVQLEVQYNPSAVALGAPSLTADDDSFSLRYRDHGDKMVIVLYQLNLDEDNLLLQAGAADLVTIPVTAKAELQPGDIHKLRLADAKLSTASAGQIPLRGISAELPFDFMLAQNYPNPFNPTTVIEFSIGSGESSGLAQRVKLDVFNVLGQKVSTLIDNEDMGPGTYSVTWDATNSKGLRVATGIYLYRLQVGDESRAKKMLFLK